MIPTPQAIESHPDPWGEPVVYYMVNLDRWPAEPVVKIGTTIDLPRRFHRYAQRHAMRVGLLAWEPGSYEVERRRLDLCWHLRVPPRDWHVVDGVLVDLLDDERGPLLPAVPSWA